MSAICGAVGTQPIPLADFPILTTLQSSMVAGIMHISGRDVSLKMAGEWLAALGANIGMGLAMREGARAMLKLVPLWGDVVSGGIAAAGTYAIGKAAIAYFIEGVSIGGAKTIFRFARRAAQNADGRRPLMKLSTIQATLAEHGLQPTRSLGQNFLHDQNLAEWIVNQLALQPGEPWIEIGPGLGALTEYARATLRPRGADRKGRSPHRLSAGAVSAIARAARECRRGGRARVLPARPGQGAGQPAVLRFEPDPLQFRRGAESRERLDPDPPARARRAPGRRAGHAGIWRPHRPDLAGAGR